MPEKILHHAFLHCLLKILAGLLSLLIAGCVSPSLSQSPDDYSAAIAAAQLPDPKPPMRHAREVDVAAAIAREMQGRGLFAKIEHRLPDGARVDILTTRYAIEVDFEQKWAESIGQSLYYGIKTHRDPAVLLLVTDDQDDGEAYLKRLNAVASVHHIAVFVKKLPP